MNARGMIAKPLDGKVNVTTRTTAAACIEHNQVGHVVGRINMANASNLGGGVRNGESAQEEAEMREMTSTWISYLEYMQRVDTMPWDSDRKNLGSFYIHPAEVLVTKGTFDNQGTGPYTTFAVAAPSLLKGKSVNNPIFHSADVKIFRSLSAEKKKRYGFNERENLKSYLTNVGIDTLMEDIIENLLFEAYDAGVTHLVLGALGTGVYNNLPAEVARNFSTVLNRTPQGSSINWKNHFEIVEFAIAPGRADQANPERALNYQEFKIVFP